LYGWQLSHALSEQGYNIFRFHFEIPVFWRRRIDKQSLGRISNRPLFALRKRDQASLFRSKRIRHFFVFRQKELTMEMSFEVGWHFCLNLQEVESLLEAAKESEWRTIPSDDRLLPWKTSPCKFSIEVYSQDTDLFWIIPQFHRNFMQYVPSQRIDFGAIHRQSQSE
jgi:hypothetical protein